MRTLACVAGRETIDYKLHGEPIEEPIADAWERFTKWFPAKQHEDSEYIDLDGVTIYGTSGYYVICRRIIKNPNQHNWLKLTLETGQELHVTRDHPFPVALKGRIPAEWISVGDQLTMDDGMPYSVTGNVPVALDEPSYDVETESDFFFVSRVLSNNCRTGLSTTPRDHARAGTPEEVR